MPIYEVEHNGRRFDVEAPSLRAALVAVKRMSGTEPSALSRFASNAGEMLNPVTAVKGLAQAVAHPLQTYDALVDQSAEQFGKAGEAYQQGRTIEAMGHGVAGAIPFVGPAAAEAGEQIAAGDWAGGAGRGAGLLTGAALAGPAARTAGRIARPIAQRAAPRLYQSALKPTKAVLNDVRPRPGSTAQETLLQTGLDERIPVTAGGVRKVETLIDSLNADVQARVAQIQAAGEKVDPVLVERAIDDVAREFTAQINAQPDLAAIDAVRQNFRSNPLIAQQTPGGQMRPGLIDPVTAQQMKVNTYQGLRGKFDKERGATIEAEKAGARGLREGIEQAGNRAGVTDIAAVNAREGAAISLEHALVDAMRRRGNYDVLGLKPAIGAATAAASNSALPLLVTLIDRFPGLVSRSGIWINRTGRRSGRVTQRAAQTTTAGATTPTESRRRTRGPALQTP